MSKTEKRTVIVKHKFGIHARPAAKIVALCNTFSSNVEILKEGEPIANGKNILDIMMLGAASGSTLGLTIRGEDAEAAAEKLSTLLESDFNTDDT